MEGFDESPGDQNMTNCTSSIDMEKFLHYSMIPSVFVIVVLTLLERRNKRWPLDTKFRRFGGCCGVVSPFDFVGSFHNRWTLGFAFGATADKLMYLFSGGPSLFEHLPSWAKALLLVPFAIEVGLSTYPFFACLSTSYEITGAILGFFYTAIWLTVILIDIVQCPEGRYLGYYEDVITFWPSALCHFLLLCRFVQMFVQAVRAQCGLDTVIEETSFQETHQVLYVQRLLRKPLSTEPQKSWIRRILYAWDPCFQFPTRMIVTAVLVVYVLYMIMMIEIVICAWMYPNIKLMTVVVKEFLLSLNATREDLYFVDEGVQVVAGVLLCTLALTALTCVSYVFHILACYRKHIMWLRAGKRQFLMLQTYKVSPSLSVASIARYSSWQVAFLIWGYVIMHLVQFIMGMCIMYMFILPIKHGQWSQLFQKWGTVVLTFVIVMVIKKVPILLAPWVFLQPKIGPDDKQRPLALNNRKLFQNFSYFLFFYSVVVGLTSCLLRLLRSLIVGAWLIARLDKAVMPKGYETSDAGFTTWVGMLLMDHYHTNPILVCFCHILLTRNRERYMQRAIALSLTDPMGVGTKKLGRARTRWLLLYTLLNNPSLQAIRKRKINSHYLGWQQNSSF